MEQKTSYTAKKLLENNQLVNFGLGLGSVGSSMQAGGPFSIGKTSQGPTVNQSSQFNPSSYYDLLRNYPFLQTLVNILKAPIEEAIDQVTNQIKVAPSGQVSNVVKDAVIIVNNFFERCDFKTYLKNHLEEFILRGSYVSYIDYRGGKFIDLINPYDFKILHNGLNFSWINPSEQTSNDNVGFNSVNGLSYLSSGLTGNQNKEDGFRYDSFVEYHYKLETVERKSRKTLGDLKNNTKEYELLSKKLNNNVYIRTAQKLTDSEKERLDNILVLYTVHRPKSLFEPFLKNLFILSIKELVFSLLSLLQYLKSDFITVNIRHQSGVDDIQNEKEANIIKNIKAALNRFNSEMVRSAEDPSGLLNMVFEKLINRTEVLPSVDEYSDLQVLNIPDLEQRLSTLYQDILENKRAMADEIGIAQESISGNSNRWEAISRNEKMTLTIMNIKSTIEDFICQTACNVFYNHVNNAYWNKKINDEKYNTSFNFSNKTHTLSEKGGMVSLLTNFEKKDDGTTEYESVGITLKPSNFVFKLNLSTILESYASKSKEIIISESLQSTASVIENVKNFMANKDILNTDYAVDYICNILSIGENLNRLIDKNKLKELLNAEDGGGDMMGDDMMMEGDPNMEGMDPSMMEQGGMDPNMMGDPNMMQ